MREWAGAMVIQGPPVLGGLQPLVALARGGSYSLLTNRS
jgi:hypothetical protein